MATGEHALSLLDFRDKLITIPIDCIYHHFWGIRLLPHFTHPEYHNDFAMWIHQAFNDEQLAEKLSIVDPTQYSSLEDMRSDILAMVERRLEDYEVLSVAKMEDVFHFVRSILIVIETSSSIQEPTELPQKIRTLSTGSFFYHFIDAKTRTEEKWNDVSTWLLTWGDQYSPLIESMNSIDPYFLPLTSLRERIISTINHFFKVDESVTGETKC